MHEKTKRYAKQAIAEFSEQIFDLMETECNTRVTDRVRGINGLANDMLLFIKVIKARGLVKDQDAKLLMRLCERKAKKVLGRK